MKKQILIIGMTFLFLAVGLSGCQKQTTTEKSTTASIETFALTLNDLPEGYTMWGGEPNRNTKTNTIKDIEPVEVYSVAFENKQDSYESGVSGIGCIIYKFRTVGESHIALINISEITSYTNDAEKEGFLNRITPQNVRKIGNESIYELYRGPAEKYKDTLISNQTNSEIVFRIENIVVHLILSGYTKLNTDYVNLTINYAKIVENRINASLK